jgi:hypothetical protein
MRNQNQCMEAHSQNLTVTHRMGINVSHGDAPTGTCHEHTGKKQKAAGTLVSPSLSLSLPYPSLPVRKAGCTACELFSCRMTQGRSFLTCVMLFRK